MVNYGNRNASSSYSSSDIAKSYLCACTASITVALSIRRMFKKQTSQVTGSRLIIYNSFSAMIAVACAGYLNAYLMR